MVVRCYREVVVGVVVHRLMRKGGTSGSITRRFVFGDLLDLLDRFDDGVADHARSQQGFILRSGHVSIARIMAGATHPGVVSMVMMMVMVFVVPYFVSTVVQLIEIILVHILHVRVFDDVEILPNVVGGLVLTTANRTVAMVVVISFTVVVIIVVVVVIRWLILMVAKVASANVIVVDVVVLIGNLHLCLLL